MDAEKRLNNFIRLYEDILHPNITSGLIKCVSEFKAEMMQEAKDFAMSKELQELGPMLLRFQESRLKVGEAMAQLHLKNINKEILRLYPPLPQPPNS
jgi:hypothetical protein